LVVLVKPLEKFQKIEGVRCLEGPVHEVEEWLSVNFPVVQDEVVRRPVHEAEKLGGLVDDGFSLAPCEHCRPESGDFDVLFFRETVGHGNRVAVQKMGLVEAFNTVVEQDFKVGFCHFYDSIGRAVKNKQVSNCFFQKIY
jgi:hypothetical protein